MGFEVLPYHNLVTIVAWSNEQMDRLVERGGEDGSGSALGPFRPQDGLDAPSLKISSPYQKCFFAKALPDAVFK
jgi:hypothetical protein